MTISDAEYRVSDMAATGPQAVDRAFENQVAYCRDNGAPITALVCEALREVIAGDRGGMTMMRVRRWAGPALADALPLRVAGGLHALHLSGEEPALKPIYEGLAPNEAAEILAGALERHEPFLMPWLDGPPQTNEAGRSWAFAAAMLWLAEQGLPSDFALFELGSSAGINLMMRRYFFDLGGVTAGPRGASMRITPEWRGSPPPDSSFEIVGAEGCDIAPVDLTDPDQALRLRAYIWPEFTTRFARMDAAIEAANTMPPDVAKMRAADFVDDVLAREPQSGVMRMLMHSVVWQYVPEDEKARITAAMEAAGAEATPETPLAWVRLEANRDSHRHELSVRYWPDGGDDWTWLADAHPHGEWVDWKG